jgi:capsid protein
MVIAKADRRFSFRQLILIQRLIRPVWAYVIGDAIASGTLEAVPGWWKITCTTPRKVTVDTGREAQQNREDVQMGLKSLEQHFVELGQDFEEEMRVRAQNAKRILELAEEHGVPVEMLYGDNKGQRP